MEDHRNNLPARGLGDILNETFAIYGKHFRRLLALVAIVQVPASLLTLITSGGMATFVIVGLLSALAGACAYAGVVFAVGQHYLTGEVDISACYARVWGRIASLLTLAVVLAVVTGLGLLLAVIVVPAFVMIVVMVYWSLSSQAVVVEGRKPLDALKRSFRLVQGSWWRVFGITVVLLLVLLGLGLVLAAPFALASRLVAPDGNTVSGTAFEYLSGLIVAVAVPPLLAIATTLLYYDLRVRKENYDFNALSREMGRALV